MLSGTACWLAEAARHPPVAARQSCAARSSIAIAAAR